VRQICTDHNHTIVPEAFRHAAANRALDADSRATAALMLDLGANATKVRHHLMITTQKVVTQHDVQNIRTTAKVKASDTDAVHRVVEMLNQTDNAVVRIVANEDDGTVQSVFYQTAFMRRMFEAYPETVVFDATYKVNNRNMPLFLPLVVDSAGYSQVAAVILTVDERSETLAAAVAHFSDISDKVGDVRCLVVDKDLSAIDVLQSQFTSAAVNLCQFHCLRTFRREITESRMQITPSQKTTVLELLTQLSHASNPDEYDTAYKDLTALNIPTVTDYYNMNWHGCREQWVPCYKNSVANFGMSGTQRIESLHQKVKQVVKCNAVFGNLWRFSGKIGWRFCRKFFDCYCWCCEVVCYTKMINGLLCIVCVQSTAWTLLFLVLLHRLRTVSMTFRAQTLKQRLQLQVANTTH